MARSEGVSLGGGDCRSSSPVSSHPQCKDEEPMRPMEDTGRENADCSVGRTPCAAMEPEYLCSIIHLP